MAISKMNQGAWLDLDQGAWQESEASAAGWPHDLGGIPSANVGAVGGTDKANIADIGGTT